MIPYPHLQASNLIYILRFQIYMTGGRKYIKHPTQMTYSERNFLLFGTITSPDVSYQSYKTPSALLTILIYSSTNNQLFRIPAIK
jgi:hypothetical protein